MPEASLRMFISQNRIEIYEMCVEHMKRASPERTQEEIASGFETVIDEIVRALEHKEGLPVSSPLPGKSAAASQHGGARQRGGDAISKVSLDFGSISDVVGELASASGLRFDAGEYRVFNQCVDTAIASALEEYWAQARQQQEHETNARVGFLGHELRNALSSARMAYSVLRRGELGIHSKTGEVLDRGLRRLEALINQMLLAVQLHGGMKPEPRRLRVTDLLQELREAAVPEREIRVTVETEEGLEVDADERLLFSAVSNLLQNALKFTRFGGRVVLRGRGEGGRVVIEVEDECGGLPPGTPEELFVPYVRRSADRRGLVLGLAITKEAVEAHGGSIVVRNLPPRGCVFALQLPASFAS